jgi:WD40 repeat protein
LLRCCVALKVAGESWGSLAEREWARRRSFTCSSGACALPRTRYSCPQLKVGWTLAPREHRLRLTLAGFREYEQNIDLVAGNTFRVAAELEPSELAIAETAEAPSPAGILGTPPATESMDDSVPGFVLDRTLEGHSGWVTGVAFSSDALPLASVGWDDAVKLWDVTTGQGLGNVADENKGAEALAFSGDGHWLAAESSINSVALWDATSGREIRTLPGNEPCGLLKRGNWVYSIVFSPDSRWLASASGDKSVKLWDVVAGREVYTLEGHRSSVTSVAFSPDGRWLASGSWDRTVKIWGLPTRREVPTLAGHTHRIYTITIDSGGRWLASGSEDGTIKLWRLRRPINHSPAR